MTYRLYASLFCSTAGLATATMALPAYAQAPHDVVYNLPAQALGDTLKAIALSSGTNILAAGGTVEGITAPALAGRYSVAQALALTLKGTGLHARTMASGIAVESDGAATNGESDSKKDADSASIVVTGSRIRGAPVAAPVITLSENSIRNAGQASLGEVVRSIPQSFGGGQQPGIGYNVPAASGVDIGGGSSINLRGLGSDATLTLLNGHRVSYSSSRQSVDVSTIPLSAIDRLEIVPDGASAIYGSDAVAGVANIILKRDYQGLETRARLGGSTDGGNFSQQYGVLTGARWTGGGFALAYEYNSNSLITSNDRSYARDATPGLTLFPSLKSHSALLTFHQALTPSLTFSLDALYSQRHENSIFPIDFGGDIVTAHAEAPARSRAFAIAPALDWTVSRTWHLTLSATYAADRSDYRTDIFTGTVRDDSKDSCYCNKGQSVELGGAGSLATMPAGDIKAAFGVGYRNNDFKSLGEPDDPQNIIRSQDSRYAFGELALPVVSPGQGVRGIDRLDLSAAVRYERYPGIGSVATPKFGMIYAPSGSFDVKASWGKSYRAPTLRQQYQPPAVQLFRATALGGTGYPAGATVLYVVGGKPDLRPERATSWSATLAIHPPALAGARLEISYFDTRYRDRIVTPIASISGALSNPQYAPQIGYAPSAAQLAALIANATAFFNASGAAYDPANVVAIADNSQVNAGRQQIHGIDALLDVPITLGAERTLDLVANASYLKSKQQISVTQPVTQLAGTIFNPPHVRARGGASWSDKALTLSAFYSYAGSVRDNRTAANTKLEPNTSFDLTARYRTPASAGAFSGLDVTLAVQNLFNDKPSAIPVSLFLLAPYDSTNGSPIGRFVSLTVAKKW
ncbi:TonB-dependent receptor (plasmid) [Sphingomonas paeninsulae]|uniref:TonB-dependent receptor n=1 Tax=Sphingomonas paeninsulae TaxID=2319844 RepID=A0A494TG68_SPHPE|nr:TonB-dependent receptor [Sphingomonas paeninsulae]AYJ84846.1 TonB-dependent receptor [Sphingomonas paeninsulae]